MFEMQTIVEIGVLILRAAEHDPTVQADVNALIEKFKADVKSRLDAAESKS